MLSSLSSTRFLELPPGPGYGGETAAKACGLSMACFIGPRALAASQLQAMEQRPAPGQVGRGPQHPPSAAGRMGGRRARRNCTASWSAVESSGRALRMGVGGWEFSEGIALQLQPAPSKAATCKAGQSHEVHEGEGNNKQQLLMVWPAKSAALQGPAAALTAPRPPCSAGPAP